MMRGSKFHSSHATDPALGSRTTHLPQRDQCNPASYEKPLWTLYYPEPWVITTDTNHGKVKHSEITIHRYTQMISLREEAFVQSPLAKRRRHDHHSLGVNFYVFSIVEEDCGRDESYVEVLHIERNIVDFHCAYPSHSSEFWLDLSQLVGRRPSKVERGAEGT